MPFIDVHCHLLPGLDDGAPSDDEMLRHARRLAAEGVREVVCTPHVKRAEFPAVAVDAIHAHVTRAQAALVAAGVALRLHPGGELAHPDALALDPAALDRIAQGPPRARWLLLEAPFEGFGDDFARAFARVRALGYGVLVAHPERAAGVLRADGRGWLRSLLADGALLQVNVDSLRGDHGLEAQAAALRLVREGRTSCLASDGHPGTREQTLALGVELLLRAGVSRAEAHRLTRRNPRLLLREGIRRTWDAPTARPTVAAAAA